MRRTLTICLLFIALTGTRADEQPKRLLTADDLWRVQRVGPPSMAPDGKACIVEVTKYDIDKDDSTSDLWLLSTDGKEQRQLTNSAGKSSNPKWSPDGQSIAFVAKRGADDPAQIYVIPPAGGEARRVSHVPFGPTALKWSGDSKTVYFIAWTWPDAADDEAYKKKEKQLKDAKSKAFVIDDAQFRLLRQVDRRRQTAVRLRGGRGDREAQEPPRGAPASSCRPTSRRSATTTSPPDGKSCASSPKT